MKSVKLLMVVCMGSMLLFANAYSQTTDTKESSVKAKSKIERPATTAEQKVQKPATAVKPKVQKPVAKKSLKAGQTRSKKGKSKSAARKRKSDVPDIPLTNARITFNHTEFDFGAVPPGAKITHHFPVSNTGPDTLVITKIKAG